MIGVLPTDNRQLTTDNCPERWLCSCGEDVTPVPASPEGWFFHWLGGHRIDVVAPAIAAACLAEPFPLTTEH